MENVTNNVMEILNQIAAKLGVAAEHLWKVLIKQQYADGLVLLILAAACIIVFCVTWHITPKLHKQWKDRYEELRKDREENGTGFSGSYTISSLEEDKYRDRYQNVWSVAIVIMIGTGILGLILLISGIRPILNPDYFAIKDIMYMISNGV